MAASAPGDVWTASDGSGSAAATYGHAGCDGVDADGQCTGGAWLGLPGAVWIWRSRDADQSLREITLTKKFYVSSGDASNVGLLRIAGDNDFHAELNGEVVADGDQYATTVDVAVPLEHGLNTMVVTVTNQEVDPPWNNPYNNPAGVTWSIARSPGLTASELYGLANPLSNTAPCKCADPVDNATGNFSETVEDLTASATGTGGLPIAATRSYNSLAGAHDGPFGHGWTSSYDWSLHEDSTTGIVTVTAGNGATSEFFPDGAGGYGAGNQVLASLSKISGGGWKLVRRPHSTLIFNNSGQLTSMSRVAGTSTVMTYSAGRLATVTDAAGRSLTYSYDTDGHVSSVTGPGSRSVSYTYDASGDLRTVTDAAGKTTSMTYADHQMLTLTDPRGGQTVNAYDSQGRVATQKDPAASAGSLPATTWDYATGTGGDSTTTVTDPNGSVHVFEFHNNLLKSQTSASGTSLARTTTYGYDASLQPSTVTDPRGNVTKYGYDAAGDLTKLVDALGQTQRFTYDSAGDRLTATGPGTEPASSWTYNTDGLPLTATDPKGRTTTWTYTGAGDVNTVTSPRGKVTDNDYTAGNLTTTTSPGGNVSSWTYDPSGWAISSTDPRGNVTGASPATKEQYSAHFTYDPMGRVLTTTDAADTVTTNTYDENGNLTRATTTPPTGPAIRTLDCTYTPTNRVKTAAIGARTVLTNTYDPAGHLTSSTDGTGATTSYTYDAADQMSTRTTARGNAAGATAADYTWTYLYDLNGNRTDVIDPEGLDAATAYDELNRPITQTTRGGHVTTTSYDPYGRVSKVVDPLGGQTNYGYTTAGELASQQLPGQGTSTYEYNADGERTKQTSPSGTSVTTWTYTDDGQVHTQVDPNGNATGATPGDYTTTDAYDPAGNLTSQSDELGNTTTWTYDPVGNQVSETDPRSLTATWAYDRLGQLTQVVPPGTLGGTTTYAYDQYGDLKTRTEGSGATTTYSYDNAHHLTQILDQLNRKRTFTYDPEGQLASWTTARGYAAGATASDWTVNQTFDAHGLLTARTTSGTAVNAGSSATMTYDNDANMTQVVDGTGTTTMGYDDDRQLTSVAKPQGNYTYTYNGAGQVTSRTYPSSGTIRYKYNTDGLQESLTADSRTTTFGYDANQALNSITYPASLGGLVQSREYDRAGNISLVQNKKTAASTPVSKFEYQRDADYNPTSIRTTRGATVVDEAYTYDSTNAISKDCPGVSTCAGAANYIAYTYASNGNGHRSQEDRVGTVTNPGTNTYTYDAADQLTQKVTAPAGGTATTTNYTYTAEGQLASGARTWNVLGQLTGSNTTGTNPASFTYDGLGNRRAVTTSAGTKKESWDTNNPMPMLAVITDTANKTYAQRYTPTGDVLETQHPAGTYASSYYGHDAMGSVTDVLEGNGTLAWDYAYEPFGTTKTSNSLVTGAVQTNFGYTGAYKETTLDQYALRARDYDTTLGRFTAPDPLTPSINDAYISPYVYANNEPTVLSDPTGLFSIGAAWSATTGWIRGDPRPNQPSCQAGDAIGGVLDGLGVNREGFCKFGYGGAEAVNTLGAGLYRGMSFGFGSDAFDCRVGVSGDGALYHASEVVGMLATAAVGDGVVAAVGKYGGRALVASGIFRGSEAAANAAEDVGSGVARSPSFIVKPNGETVIVPKGAEGPFPVESGKGFMFRGGSGGHGLSDSASDVRIMDPVTGGKYPKPNGYASYLNGGGQTINPFTGQTVGKSSPWWHWEFLP